MSSRSVLLDEAHFLAAEEKARALGTSTGEFVGRLIDVAQALDDLSFDQLLTPVRKGFEHLSDSELDNLFSDAKKTINGSNAP